MHSFKIEWIPTTASTNSDVVELAKKFQQKNLVLATDHQSAGRGQFGRKWLSQPGENLLFSIYFEPAINPSQAFELTQIACRAIVEVLTHYQICCEIKKPNDVLVGGKKICGILTESSSKGKKLEYVVVGIGLNVNSTAETLIPEATSMRIEKQKHYDRAEVLDKILRAFEIQSSEFCALKEMTK